MNSAIKWAAIIAIGLGVVSLRAAAGAETGVTVVRGTPSKSAAAKTSAGLPTVLRGRQAGSSNSTATRKRRSRGAATGWITTGGETLWLVQRHGGRIVGCWMQGSTQAGQSEIRCARSAWR